MISKKHFVISSITTALVLLAGCQRQDPAASAQPTATRSAQAQSASAAKPSAAPVPASAQFAVAAADVAAIKGAKESGVCSLENIISVADNVPHSGEVPNSYKVDKAVAYKLIGFATNKESKVVPPQVQLALVGGKAYSISTNTGSPRPDVAKFFNQPAFSAAGYQADAAFDNVEAGDYSVFVLEPDGAGFLACPTHQKVTVR